MIGNCVYHVAHQNIGTWVARVGRNREMPNYTQALYDARELAMDADAGGGAVAARRRGSSASSSTRRSHGWGSHVIEFLAIGTAIVTTTAEHEIAPPVLDLNLNDPPPSLK